MFSQREIGKGVLPILIGVGNISFTLDYVKQAGGKVYKDIVDQYQAFMYRHGWTQTQAAEKIQCTQEHLSRVFRGLRIPSAKLLDRMEAVMEETK